MKVENGRKVCCGIAYWKGRWVAVPFFHLPEEAISEEGKLARFRVIPLDGETIDVPPTRENKALEKIFTSVKETIVPWVWSKKDLKLLCARNDLPLSWITDRYPRKIPAQRTEGTNRRQERKIRSLSATEFRQIHKELAKLDEKIAIIVSILWFLNNSLGKGGCFVTLEEVVRLQVEDIAPDHEGSRLIHLIRTGVRSTGLIVHYLPSRLWNALCRQISEDSIFVFSTRDGGPIFPNQVDAYLKKAAKQAGFKEPITSVSLRPQCNQKEVERVAKKHRHDVTFKPYLEPVTPEEWKEILEHVPAIHERRGRKASHSPLELLNGILYLMKTRCSLRNLSDQFPPWSAVDSQQRRWKKTGILEAIFAFRKSKTGK